MQSSRGPGVVRLANLEEFSAGAKLVCRISMWRAPLTAAQGMLHATVVSLDYLCSDYGRPVMVTIQGRETLDIQRSGRRNHATAHTTANARQ